MTCDRAVTLLATGGPLGRWRARRHCSHCPNCAAEAARIRRIARELSAVEPLSAAQRALWSSASTDPRPLASRPPRFRRALLAGWAAAVVLVLVANVAWRLTRGPGPGPRPGPAIVVANPPDSPGLGRIQPETPPETIRELGDLEVRLRALSRDLAQLRGRAELLDERREAEALARRFRPSVAARDLLGPPTAFAWDADPLPLGLPDRSVDSAAARTPGGADQTSGVVAADPSPSRRGGISCDS
jgi:hypothetical protein